MSAVVTNQTLHIDPPMKGALVLSAMLHAGVIVFAWLGVPYLKPEPVVLNTATVEIVRVDAETATNKPPARRAMPKNDAPAPPAKPKPPPRMASSSPPKLTAPAPPKLSEDLSKPVTPSIPPPRAKEERTPPPKPEKSPEAQNSERQRQEFSSLLRNLTPHAPERRPDEPSVQENQGEGRQTPSPLARFAQQVSSSEMDALRNQLAGCWSVPAGAKYAENLVVEVRIFVNPDRTVREAQILDRSRYNRDTAFRAAAESAVRAVYHPMCNPLRLPPDKYEQWKTIVVQFDPRKMLQ